MSPDEELLYDALLIWLPVSILLQSDKSVSGPLAQSEERCADNAKVVSSSLTRTNVVYYFFSQFLLKSLLP